MSIYKGSGSEAQIYKIKLLESLQDTVNFLEGLDIIVFKSDSLLRIYTLYMLLRGEKINLVLCCISNA
jgi:hypothetical protein